MSSSESNVKYVENKKLNKSQIEFMKIIEQQNIERVKKLHTVRRNNLITAGCLGVSVLGIYAYSMFSVAQEKFLDDFNEPETTSTASAIN